MILVDSSVWIDYFRGTASAETALLDALIDRQSLLLGDIILTEILQGFTNDRQLHEAIYRLGAFECIDVVGRDIALQAAHNFRLLRAKGVTIRKTIDTLIATRCIQDDIALLFSDRDFQPFVEHLGLVSAL